VSSEVYIGLGSNLGNRLGNIRGATRYISSCEDLRLIDTSPIFESNAWGVTDQPKFLNAVIVLRCLVSPHGLLQIAKRIEQKLGRKRSKRWGPRTIDIDILFYGDISFSHKVLTIPHKQTGHRAFVIKPLLELKSLSRPRRGFLRRSLSRLPREQVQTVRKLTTYGFYEFRTQAYQ